MKYIKTYREAVLESDRWIDTGRVELGKDWWAMRRDPSTEYIDAKIRIDDTMTYQILKFIYKKGTLGAKYSDIIRFIVEDLKRMGDYNWKEHRGYWSTNLNKPNGVLTRYAIKNNSGRWILNNPQLERHFDDLSKEGKLEQSYITRKTGLDQGDIDALDTLGIDIKDLY